MHRQWLELSPSLTATSSASTFASSSYQPDRLDKGYEGEFDIAMDQQQEITDYLLAIDEDDHGDISQTHSPSTMSPNRTPSPVLGAKSPATWSPSAHLAFPSSPDAMFPDFSYDDAIAKLPEAGPSSLPMVNTIDVKQEPVEFGWVDPAQTAALPQQPPLSSITTTTTTAAPAVSSTTAAGMATNGYTLSPQDQAILMDLFRNLSEQTLQDLLTPKTIAPSDLTKPAAAVNPAVLSNVPLTPISPPVAPKTSVATEPPAVQSVQRPPPAASSSTTAAASVPAKRRKSESTLDDIAEDEPLNAVSPEDEEEARRARATSTLSFGPGSELNDLDLDAKLGLLVPSDAIFSAGRGKGGKKGGGMSSVVRGDDEDLDDDDSWRPSPEEYKKLSSKEKRQLRNKLSARAFRTRRKDYISTLEGHIKDRDAVIDHIKSELVNTRSENLDLKKELAALKASAMSVLHPETAFKPSPAPAVSSNVIMTSTTATTTTQPSKPAAVTAPTPKFNPRKDLSASPAIAKSFWGGNGPLGHHGNMTVHTVLTPEIGLPPVRPIDLSRENLNPLLNEATPASQPSSKYRSYPLSHSTVGAADLSNSFADWSEDNAFSLRSLDSYRTQMWSRLTREAHAEKMGIAVNSRPKFFATHSPKQETDADKAEASTSLATLAQSELAIKLAGSVIEAFADPYGAASRTGGQRLTDVVTGSRPRSAGSDAHVVDQAEENRRKKLSPTYEADEQLAMALGGLRLQSGFSSPREYRSASAIAHSWENPIGALADMFTFGLGPVGRA